MRNAGMPYPGLDAGWEAPQPDQSAAVRSPPAHPVKHRQTRDLVRKTLATSLVHNSLETPPSRPKKPITATRLNPSFSRSNIRNAGKKFLQLSLRCANT